MAVIKLILSGYEQSIYTLFGATSWLDLANCIFSFCFVGILFLVTLALPLAYGLALFLVP